MFHPVVQAQPALPSRDVGCMSLDLLLGEMKLESTGLELGYINR